MADLIPAIGSALTEAQIDQMSILVLSFVGDSVQTLYERTAVAVAHDCKAGLMHKMVSQNVNARRQAEAVKSIEELFSSREADIFRRARNVHPNQLPKHSSQEEYRAASGFEAVLGYLYLTGQTERLTQILYAAYSCKQKENKQ